MSAPVTPSNRLLRNWQTRSQSEPPLERKPRPNPRSRTLEERRRTMPGGRGQPLNRGSGQDGRQRPEEISTSNRSGQRRRLSTLDIRLGDRLVRIAMKPGDARIVRKKIDLLISLQSELRQCNLYARHYLGRFGLMPVGICRDTIWRADACLQRFRDETLKLKSSVNAILKGGMQRGEVDPEAIERFNQVPYPVGCPDMDELECLRTTLQAQPHRRDKKSVNNSVRDHPDERKEEVGHDTKPNDDRNVGRGHQVSGRERRNVPGGSSDPVMLVRTSGTNPNRDDIRETTGDRNDSQDTGRRTWSLALTVAGRRYTLPLDRASTRSVARELRMLERVRRKLILANDRARLAARHGVDNDETLERRAVSEAAVRRVEFEHCSIEAKARLESLLQQLIDHGKADSQLLAVLRKIRHPLRLPPIDDARALENRLHSSVTLRLGYLPELNQRQIAQLDRECQRFIGTVEALEDDRQRVRSYDKEIRRLNEESSHLIKRIMDLVQYGENYLKWTMLGTISKSYLTEEWYFNIMFNLQKCHTALSRRIVMLRQKKKEAEERIEYRVLRSLNARRDQVPDDKLRAPMGTDKGG